MDEAQYTKTAVHTHLFNSPIQDSLSPRRGFKSHRRYAQLLDSCRIQVNQTFPRSLSES